MKPMRQLGHLGVIALGFLGACMTPKLPTPPPEEPSAPPIQQAVTAPAGALVDLSSNSTVGVLLDEYPAGAQRDAAAAYALAQGDDFWQKRALTQVRLMFYRLIFRGLYYASDWANSSKKRGPLPLPPKSVWQVNLGGPAHRVMDNGRELVTRDYSFHSMLVTDAASTAATEPNLATVGGTWDEAFNLPTDPTLLLERTGYACMDEDEYPPFSVFEENTAYFFDDSCKQEPPTSASCHITEFPQESCVTAMAKNTGIVKTSMHFARIAYNAATAAQYRVGTITNANGADLEVVQEDVEDEHSLFYRYFAPGSCELEEGVISKLGWRHLLAFSATVRNNGAKALHIGKLSDPTNPYVTSKVYEFSACHGHYHFSHYGSFSYNGAPGSKRAFCLEETNRFHNTENSPLTATHQSCDYQGIGPGWGDEYEWGIPGQWVDVTDVESKKALPLTFSSNPDQFMCEGATLNASGAQVEPEDLAHLAFVPSGFTSPTGEPILRVSCNFPSTWDDNNFGSAPVTAPSGESFVTQACKHGEISPVRDCSFRPRPGVTACAAGASITLRCTSAGAPQVVRICEISEKLGVGVACPYRDAKANVVVYGSGTDVTFGCPAVRDAAAAGAGGYALYTAAAMSGDAAARVTCTPL